MTEYTHSGIESYEEFQARIAAKFGMTADEWEYGLTAVVAAGDDDQTLMSWAVAPMLDSVGKGLTGNAAEQNEQAFRHRVVEGRQRDYGPARPADTRPKGQRPTASTRPKGTRREHQARTAKTSGGQDPGDDGGDPDPDLVEARVRQLVDEAPALSSGQAGLLARLLGGAR